MTDSPIVAPPLAVEAHFRALRVCASTPALPTITLLVAVLAALHIGLTLLRKTWPHAAPYVLIPPLALVILSQLTRDRVGWLGGTVIVISYLLNLIAKGATASYYLRLRQPVGPDRDVGPIDG